MDLRSMLNSDVSHPSAARSSPGKPSEPLKAPPLPAQLASPYQFGARRDTHPLPPPQLQPAHNGEQPSSIGAPQYHRPSPSQYTPSPSSAAAGVQYPFPPSLPGSKLESPQAAHGHQFERAATMPQTNGQHYALNQQHPPLLPPTLSTATNAFPPPHYRPSSVHSATPTSANSQGTGFHRDGSGAGIGHSPIQQVQPYHLQRYQSFPDTPTGAHPPFIDGQSPVMGREGSAPRLQEPSSGHSSASYLTPPSHKPLLTPDSAAPVFPPPAAQPPAQNLPTNHDYLSTVERERSESVSPKSMVPSQKRELNHMLQGPPLHPTADRPNDSGAHEQRDAQANQPSHFFPSTATKTHSLTPERDIRPEVPPPEFRDFLQVSSEKMDVDAHAPPSSGQPASEQSAPTQPASTQPAASQPAEPPKTSPKPKSKREKFNEIPIWARKVTGTKRTRIIRNKPTSNGNRPNGNGIRKRSPPAPGRTTPPRRSTPPLRELDDGPSTDSGWEKSILNLEPAEELTKVVADFLFCQVVNRTDYGPGAEIEIEAKIGQLIDRHTGDRLRLPVQSECVLSETDPSMRVAFHSAMNEDQHRSLNAFLNDAVVKSQSRKSVAAPANPGGPAPAPAAAATSPAAAPPKPRVKITYVHTRETDTFYELDAAAEARLPPHVRGLLTAQSGASARGAPAKPRVRVSVDQKTGTELARLIKVRLADLDVHCPRAPFDWRISVNLEASLPAPPPGVVGGDAHGLTEATDRMTGQRVSSRNKDRLTYRHQAYQIDLTQVTLGEARGDKEHELEVELKAAVLREEGGKTREGRPSLFVDVVRGFVDNVRLLVRHCQP